MNELQPVQPPYHPSEADEKKMDNNFTYHSPVGSQTDRYKLIRDRAKSYAGLLSSQCPPSRELSLAMTKLEEVVFWSNAAIARNE